MKKLISISLACAMMVSLAACTAPAANNTSSATPPQGGSSTTATPDGKDPILTGEKPELKILTYNLTFDPNEQPAFKKSEELTGYTVKYFMLPAENADQKIMMEIASGADYDLMKFTSTPIFGQLVTQNALSDITPILDKYGSNINSVISELGWKSVSSADGKIYGIPQEEYGAPLDDGYGLLKGGIGFRSDSLAEVGMELPNNIDEFYNTLKAIKAKTGKAPLTATANNALWPSVLSGFNLGDPEWYDLDGTYTPRIKMPALVDYLAFMQKLYKEELLDNDMPINAIENAKEKFSNKSAAVAPLFFWDIPGILSALQTNNPDAKTLISPYLAPGSEKMTPAFVTRGTLSVHCVPKTAKNPEHAVNFYNALSDQEVFKALYIGEENVSYEIKDGSYYPIFPAFNDYQNSDKFMGSTDPGSAFTFWQARARKTPEMADAYAQMNSRIDSYTLMNSVEKYGFSQPAVQANRLTLNTMISDNMLKAIVSGTNPQEAINKIIAEWDSTGGADYEKEMQSWYTANKDSIK